MKKVVFCIPTIKKPHPECLASIEASVPFLTGWNHQLVAELGNPYISAARSYMLRKALSAGADVIVFIDHDLSWKPKDLLTLIETDGAVVAGIYRFKYEDEVYMGIIDDDKDGFPQVREDGCIKATRIPAGFMKITKEAVNKFMTAYPHLLYGPKYDLSVDLFNHGAHNGVWWGEDYSFSRNWIDCGGELWIVPNLSINHHSDEKVYPGNYHDFLMKQPRV